MAQDQDEISFQIDNAHGCYRVTFRANCTAELSVLCVSKRALPSTWNRLETEFFTCIDYWQHTEPVEQDLNALGADALEEKYRKIFFENSTCAVPVERPEEAVIARLKAPITMRSGERRQAEFRVDGKGVLCEGVGFVTPEDDCGVSCTFEAVKPCDTFEHDVPAADIIQAIRLMASAPDRADSILATYTEDRKSVV